MLRGTIVRVNDKIKPAHLAGAVGIAIELMDSGYIKVITRSAPPNPGYLVDLCYPPDTLDILEPPVELAVDHAPVFSAPRRPDMTRVMKRHPPA